MKLALVSSVETTRAKGKHGFPWLRPTTLESTDLAEECLLHLTVLLNAT